MGLEAQRPGLAVEQLLHHQGAERLGFERLHLALAGIVAVMGGERLALIGQRVLIFGARDVLAVDGGHGAADPRHLPAAQPGPENEHEAAQERDHRDDDQDPPDRLRALAAAA